MDPKAEAQFKQLETERLALFTQLKSYNNDVLNRQPAPGAWSVNQVIAHVLSAEEASLKYLQKKTLDTSRSGKTGIKESAKLLLVKILFTLPIKFKAPALLESVSGNYDINELESRWAATRKGTHEIIEKLGEEDLKKQLWKHAIAGKLNIYQMLSFFNTHFTRHHAQIERTLKMVSAREM